MLMKLYTEPAVELVRFDAQDVLTTSYEPGDNDNGKDDIFLQ